MTEFFTVTGIIFIAFVALIIAIPVLVGTAQFWKSVYDDIAARRKKVDPDP